MGLLWQRACGVAVLLCSLQLLAVQVECQQQRPRPPSVPQPVVEAAAPAPASQLSSSPGGKAASVLLIEQPASATAPGQELLLPPTQPPTQQPAPAAASNLLPGAQLNSSSLLAPPNGAPPPSPVPAQPCSLLSALQQLPNATFFVEALQATGLAPLLDDPTLRATVFVSKDSAWEALMMTLRMNKGQLLSAGALPALQSVLQYQIVPGAGIRYADLLRLPYLARLPSLFQRQPVQVYNKFGAVKLAATSRQIANMVSWDIMSCSGRAIAHVIDVVLPPDPTWRDDTWVPAPLTPALVQQLLIQQPAVEPQRVQAFSIGG